MKGSVQGIFQTGGIIGIEALKCLGSEDKTGQRTGQRESNPLRQSDSSVLLNFRKSQT